MSRGQKITLYPAFAGVYHVAVDEERHRLGYVIKATRQARGMSAEELADAIDVAPGTVYAWERGAKSPSLLMLGPLCEALGVSADVFRDLPEEPPSPVEAYLVGEAQKGAQAGARRAEQRSTR